MSGRRPMHRFTTGASWLWSTLVGLAGAAIAVALT